VRVRGDARFLRQARHLVDLHRARVVVVVVVCRARRRRFDSTRASIVARAGVDSTPAVARARARPNPARRYRTPSSMARAFGRARVARRAIVGARRRARATVARDDGDDDAGDDARDDARDVGARDAREDDGDGDDGAGARDDDEGCGTTADAVRGERVERRGARGGVGSDRLARDGVRADDDGVHVQGDVRARGGVGRRGRGAVRRPEPEPVVGGVELRSGRVRGHEGVPNERGRAVGVQAGREREAMRGGGGTDVHAGGAEGFVSRRGVEDGERERGVRPARGHGFVVFATAVDRDGGDFGPWAGPELHVLGVLLARGVVLQGRAAHAHRLDGGGDVPSSRARGKREHEVHRKLLPCAQGAIRSEEARFLRRHVLGREGKQVHRGGELVQLFLRQGENHLHAVVAGHDSSRDHAQVHLRTRRRARFHRGRAQRLHR